MDGSHGMTTQHSSLNVDLIAGLVVFLVALPLCLGVAHASNAPLLSGVIAGIVGGIIVGFFSGSHTSVSGPAAGLTAVVAAQILAVGSFQGFLVAVLLAGVLQIGLAVVRAGGFARYFPNCVISGLLAAIGIVIILKQVPHLLGDDHDDEGEMSFIQPDQENTFTELVETFFSIDVGAAVVGVSSLLLLLIWDRIPKLKKSLVPSPLIIVLYGAFLAAVLNGTWTIGSEHMVTLPIYEGFGRLTSLFTFPDFSVLSTKAVYIAAVTIAIVASLETLLNLEAVDKIDTRKRKSPPNRELYAQGIGNICSGLLGGLPVTSVIVRSSVNINAGGLTKKSAIIHGCFLFGCVVFLPQYLNRIPLAALAAILIVTGFKLAHPKLFVSFWKQGWSQFVPFMATILAIVFTDLLIGIVIGLTVSVVFILSHDLKRKLTSVVERHIGGDVLHLQFANQVSFLNRAMVSKSLEDIPPDTQILLDARETVYFDPDILQLICDFEAETAPLRNIQVSKVGFARHSPVMPDNIIFADYTSKDVRDQLTPNQALKILADGNERFLAGTRLSRNLNRQMTATAAGQYPLAAILSCIDSRAPAELIFDVGLGDVLTVRIAGNVAKEKVFGSLEYAAAVAGVKLIVVMGHTRCGAVTTAVKLAVSHQSAFEATGCEHLGALITEIQKVIDPVKAKDHMEQSETAHEHYVDQVAWDNTRNTIKSILANSHTLKDLCDRGSIRIVGCMYDVKTGKVMFDHNAFQ